MLLLFLTGTNDVLTHFNTAYNIYFLPWSLLSRFVIMSQISSQIHDPGWVSIPFAKFSHNTSPYGTRNFVWNHVGTRNDLDFIVREVKLVDDKGNYTNRVLMRLTAGAEILVCLAIVRRPVIPY